MKKTRQTSSVTYDTLSDIIGRADSIIQQYPELTYKDFTFETVYDYGDTQYVVLEYKTDETPEEEPARIKQEEAQRIVLEEWDRKKFLELQAKYGKTS